MKFIGNLKNEFNLQLSNILNDLDIVLVSYIDSDMSYVSDDERIIQLLPINDDLNYYETLSKAYTRMIKNAFYDTLGTCTSIFIVKPESVSVEKVAKIIREFDKDNLVDNMWIYPDPIKNLQLRNNIIEDLPYQKFIAKK